MKERKKESCSSGCPLKNFRGANIIPPFFFVDATCPFQGGFLFALGPISFALTLIQEALLDFPNLGALFQFRLSNTCVCYPQFHTYTVFKLKLSLEVIIINSKMVTSNRHFQLRNRVCVVNITFLVYYLSERNLSS